MSRYPGGSITSPEWREIRARIQQRAGDVCEGCGLQNGAIGVRLPDGSFLELYEPGESYLHGWFDIREGNALWAEAWLRVFRVVCTVAHVDRQLVDHSDGNLRFWCQQCHNRHDAADRARAAAATRAARRPVTLLDLMTAPRP
jgi:hypothetical protein